MDDRTGVRREGGRCAFERHSVYLLGSYHPPTSATHPIPMHPSQVGLKTVSFPKTISLPCKDGRYIRKSSLTDNISTTFGVFGFCGDFKGK